MALTFCGKKSEVGSPMDTFLVLRVSAKGFQSYAPF